MIPLLALAAAAVAGPAGTEQRYDECVALIRADVPAAIERATRWAKAGGGGPANQCLGLAHVARQEWTAAATAFADGARITGSPGRAGDLWAQAGNSALAGGDAAGARAAFDKAIALAVLPQAMAGEAWMDRARADVALAELPTARTDLDHAIALVPDDPMGWLLSATLARRQADLARAGKDIAEAAKRAPDDPAVALEAGNIAMLGGHEDAARADWQRAVAADAGGDAGKAAKASLDQLGGGAPVAATPVGGQ